ncbi:hypothetical protein AQUCO_00500054v1 [Aquilegia coerulea]|uniref:Secreted protein n=1 Tax=Aquilegia coerulea TaxID=218851 RepID=A0A2G5EQ62_AQUCA|nr:hypothetical protein AQUCO_00500054v1 [Aquilegia coerulea]
MIGLWMCSALYLWTVHLTTSVVVGCYASLLTEASHQGDRIRTYGPLPSFSVLHVQLLLSGRSEPGVALGLGAGR